MTPAQESQLLKVLIEMLSNSRKQTVALEKINHNLERIAAKP